MIHPTAEVEPGAQVGAGTRIWHHAHVRMGAVIGANCILGYGVYVDAGVTIGDNCKLQNRVSVYHGVTIEDGVFVGPHVAFTNDKYPRAIRPDGALATDDDWTVSPILVRPGAVVTHDVPAHAIVAGNPAQLKGFACKCGATLQPEGQGWRCPRCGETHPFDPKEPAT